MGVLLGGLLEAWLVGPIYGANVILFGMTFYMLTLRGIRGTSRVLLLVVGLLGITTTAQAFTLLADLITGFVRMPSAREYFSNEGRAAKFVTLMFYIINSEICDLTWRVYVLWERNNCILIPFLVMDAATFAAGCAGIVNLQRAGIFAGYDVHSWTTVTWGCSVAVQFAGTFFIAWRAWSTPTVVSDKQVRTRWSTRAWALLWVAVDSGGLFSVSTLLLLALAFTKPMAFDVMTSALGQIAAFVSYSIALRECWKAEHEREKQYATSLLAERYDMQRARPGSRGRDVPALPMVVAIQTSRLERADGVGGSPGLSLSFSKGGPDADSVVGGDSFTSA
ncbi:hypothetical protein K488DRAFT_86070 [Vararia minispora EC-137]|uniref:Uncharacterized protein n=1 Tax=Vararia minispora EC-137 TaxID=1314806 RepID=A0ACB8QKM4_9AGAM|nr:hypothetical protein K488DRAFT_86070 [Vararia minispora EC-137]